MRTSDKESKGLNNVIKLPDRLMKAKLTDLTIGDQDIENKGSSNSFRNNNSI